MNMEISTSMVDRIKALCPKDYDKCLTAIIMKKLYGIVIEEKSYQAIYDLIYDTQRNWGGKRAGCGRKKKTESEGTTELKSKSKSVGKKSKKKVIIEEDEDEDDDSQYTDMEDLEDDDFEDFDDEDDE